MARLLVVRHAQASFMSETYDRLSLAGEEQAALLGKYWADRKLILNRAATGPAVRHRRTAEIVAGVYHKSGVTFPPLEEYSEFDEYQGHALLHHHLPYLVENNANVR